MTERRRLIAEAQVALMLLTRLPAGRIDGAAPDLIDARWAFPLVGLVIGALTWAVHALALSLGIGPPVAAFLAIAAIATLTGALHFDGLADVADGFWGGQTTQRRLEIMRDSRLGSYGALGLILGIGLWAAALSALGSAASFGHFCAVAVLSRSAMVLLQETMPQARPDGLGAAAAGTDGRARLVALASAALIVVIFGLTGAKMILVAVLVSVCLGVLAIRKIGGQTGDVLGATQILTEIACWIVLSAALA